MVEKAYAKINLGLNVLDKNDDGYHNLDTIIVPLKLHDTLVITTLSEKASDDFVTCDEYSLKVNKNNICHKAIQILRDKYGFKQKFRIHIHKNIFVLAGLGGGSADAAATIRGVCKMLKIAPTIEELHEIGRSLGWDVPWSIESKPSFVRNRGTEMESFEHCRKDYVLLVKPLKGLSTADVFLESDTYEKDNRDLKVTKEAFANDNLEELNNNLVNNLEQAAVNLLPEAKELKEKLLQEGFDTVCMTGSGSTFFCITKNKKLANKMAAKYYYDHYQVELTTFL